MVLLNFDICSLNLILYSTIPLVSFQYVGSFFKLYFKAAVCNYFNCSSAYRFLRISR